MHSSNRRQSASDNRFGKKDRRRLPERRDGLDRRSGSDRRDGSDRRKRPAIEELNQPPAKGSFILRRAIHSLRRHPARDEKPAESVRDEAAEGREMIPRAHPRTDCRASALLESGDSRDKSAATVLNYSADGFYIETDISVAPASGVILHIANYRASAPRPENIPRYFCQVRWSRPVSGPNMNKRFAVGLKICSSLNEFTRLFSL